jgi:PAS domain S-box-containing protein
MDAPRGFPLHFFVVLTLAAGRLSAQTPFPLDTVTLQLRWSHQFQFAGYYAAEEKGFYRDEGFSVHILPGRPTDVVADRVATGDAEYGVSGTDILVRRTKGTALVVLAALFQHSALAVAVRAESGILSPPDFAGKRLMINLDRNPDVKAMLLRQHVDLSSISFIADRWDINEFAAGGVDAISCFTTSQEYALQRLGVKYRIVHPSSYGVDVYGDCLFTTERELQNHPDRVAAIRRASLEGWQYAMNHPEEVIRLILDRYPPDDPNVTYESLANEAAAMRQLILPELVEVGTMSGERWRRIADLYAGAGVIDRGASVQGFIYEPRRGSDFHWVREVMVGAIIVLTGVIAVLFWNIQLRKQVRRRTSELQNKENALAEANQELNAIISASPIAITAVDTDGNVMEWNKAAEALFGWKAGEVMGKDVPFVPPEKHEEYNQLRSGVLKGTPYVGRIQRRTRRDGTELELFSSSAPLRNSAGGVTGAVAMFVDITESLRVNQQLRESLLEKEVLLKEIHHRVKNNLQVVSSLLSLQSEQILDRQAREVFRESQNRVKSMALIHERLYRSTDLAHVDFGEYVRNLAVSLVNSYRTSMPQVQCDISVVSVPMDIDIAIPCGLILNELVSNALKYAFPGGREGRIEVKFAQAADETYELTVCDDGVGLPEGFDFRNTKSLGYQLVDLLVDQVKGRLEVGSGRGVSVSLLFSAVKKAHVALTDGGTAQAPVLKDR